MLLKEAASLGEGRVWGGRGRDVVIRPSLSENVVVIYLTLTMLGEEKLYN